MNTKELLEAARCNADEAMDQEAFHSPEYTSVEVYRQNVMDTMQEYGRTDLITDALIVFDKRIRELQAR